MDYFFIFLVTILSVKYIFFWAYVWQLKEYRWDRFKDFLRSWEGRNAFLNKFYLAKIVLIILFIFLWLCAFWPIKTVNAFLYLLAAALLFFEDVIFLWKAARKQIIKPVLTKKALLLSAISFLIFFGLLGLAYGKKQSVFLVGLLLLSAVSLLVSLANLIVFPFSYYAKRHRMKLAKEIMENFSGCVIGITGSYGKSSVKEITAALLEKKYALLKTPKNINTEIGVANFIKDHKSQITNPKLNYFICEMGAYKIGEIKKMGDMVNPRIGILTGINEQHISLFGNIENTIKAKSELIKSLPQGGVAIINDDDENCKKIDIPPGLRRITYGFSEGAAIRAKLQDLKFEIQDGEIPYIVFSVEYRGESQIFKIKTIAKHNIQNLLPAIAVAIDAGMNLAEIARYLENFECPEGALKIKKIKDIIIIDDTYNSNPTGAMAALEVLDDINKDDFKVLVMDDIWELGNEAEKIHKKMAKIIATKKYNKIILVGRNYAELMRSILNREGISSVIVAGGKAFKATDFIREYSGGKITVLCEGRRSKNILNLLKE